MKQLPQRNEQFERIAELKKSYRKAGNPILSMDSKKKENIGNFFRAGQLYTTETIETYDHDFSSFGEGKVIPHAIYDLARNSAVINLGTSHDTSAFACDSIRQWWTEQGQKHYAKATSILLLCDGGGSNSSRHHIFKSDLQSLVNEIGIEIRIAHYPPYCSKYNPIEHRLFPHVSRACQGVIFKSVQLVQKLMARTQTNQGLNVTVNILDKVYETGRKASKDFLSNIPILFDDSLPRWNYRAVPQAT